MAVPFCLSVERRASRGCLGVPSAEPHGEVDPYAGSNSERLSLSEAYMSDDKTPTELNRVTAEKGREEAEDLREAADHERGSAEEHRAVAEREALRHAAEEARQAAEEARHATIAAVAATADALSANLAQMQFLEDARNTLRQLKLTKPSDVQ